MYRQTVYKANIVDLPSDGNAKFISSMDGREFRIVVAETNASESKLDQLFENASSSSMFEVPEIGNMSLYVEPVEDSVEIGFGSYQMTTQKEDYSNYSVGSIPSWWDKFSKTKKILYIILLIVVAALLIYGGYLLFKSKGKISTRYNSTLY